MNANRLRSAIAFALAKEKEVKIQANLDSLNSSLGNLAGAPNNTQFQTETATHLGTLDTALKQVEDSFTPSQKNNLVEIKAYPHFSRSMIEEINRSIAQNPMTPSVSHALVTKLLQDRQKFLEVLRSLQSSLTAVGVEIVPLNPGDAEIGVLLPRDLFHNELDGLQRELRTLNQILRTFYEVANVQLRPVEFREISTSDPILFLGVDITVLVHISHAFRWCIETIKSIGELKRFIEQAKALDIDPKKTAIFDNEIEDRVKKCIDEKVNAILTNYQGEPARKNELSNSLNLALDQMLQRVERGMTIEIRLLPPAKPAEGDADGAKMQETYAQVAEIAKSLEFPPIQGPPVLQLKTNEPSTAPAPAPAPPSQPPPKKGR